MVMEFSFQGLTDALDGVTGGLTSTGTPKAADAAKQRIAACLPSVSDARESGTADADADDRGAEARDEAAAAEEEEEEKLIAYSDEPTELYKLLKDGDWSGVIRWAQKNPIEAKTWIVEKNTDGTTRWELLHWSLAFEFIISLIPSSSLPIIPHIAVIEALLAAYKDAAHQKDSGGDLPIHLACREKAESGVILTLLLKDPDTAQTADDEGRLPIHLACRQKTSQEIVDRLLIAHHRASKTADSYGLLPLHWACAQNASVGIVQSLLRANPYAIDHSDKWGRTPLSLAKASTNPDKDAVIEALERDASYWTTSLTDEVKTLETKLGNKSDAEKKARSKAKSLEARLVEVTAASSAAAQSFRELKDELEEENTVLKQTVRELDETNKECESQIVAMKKKNDKKLARNDDLAGRLSKLMVVLSEMEEQRLSVLRITGDWEDSLQKASDLVHLDEKA
eukprot:CAMPEP_0181071596 /NCGR_PEP_ID=MMETSP1070-20121207/28123_1 /TAXON_ID=265543 /ORGANISM="Minutocellus polymorphus, Strain NH13" /LENGTH=453 /DNA_ID=CAMNT_0023152597 /DNA_START=64 /DNA_END=1427 /DNA_ORIENTATION=+